MKRLNRNISNWLTRLCALCLTLLGYSCSSEDEPDDPVLTMYGAPIGEFTVKGTVKTTDGTPVPNAVIRVTLPEFPSYFMPMCTDTTDNQGRYHIFAYDYKPDWKFVCVPPSETLEADSTLVTFDFVHDGRTGSIWYIGSASETIDFVLKKKDSDSKDK